MEQGAPSELAAIPVKGLQVSRPPPPPGRHRLRVNPQGPLRWSRAVPSAASWRLWSTARMIREAHAALREPLAYRWEAW